MTKKLSPGPAGVVDVYNGTVAVVFAGVVDAFVVFVDLVVVVVFFFVVVFDDAADAEPATSTATVAPSANITSVIATAAAALRRGEGLLTTYLPCRSPVPPGSRALRGAGRGGLRSHCGLRAPPGPRSSAEGRRRAGAARRW